MATDVALTALREEVSQQTTVIQSAVTLIGGLAAQIEAAADDPDEIHAIAATLRAQTQTLAQAVEEHTPTEPPVEPPVDPPV